MLNEREKLLLRTLMTLRAECEPGPSAQYNSFNKAKRNADKVIREFCKEV